MASTANHFCSSLTANSSISRPNTSADFFLRLQSPNAVSLRSSFVSPSSIELTRGGNAAFLTVTHVRSRSRICASSAQVMDQSLSKTGSKDPTIVEVDLGNRSYPIYIGSGLLDQPELLQRFVLFNFCSSKFQSFFILIQYRN